MNYINMFFNMWFMLVSLITVWTFESLSFMNWFYVGFKVYTFFCLIVTLRAWKWSFEWTMNWFYVCLDWVLILLLLWDVLMWVWSCPTCWAEYLQSWIKLKNCLSNSCIAFQVYSPRLSIQIYLHWNAYAILL